MGLKIALHARRGERGGQWGQPATLTAFPGRLDSACQGSASSRDRNPRGEEESGASWIMQHNLRAVAGDFQPAGRKGQNQSGILVEEGGQLLHGWWLGSFPHSHIPTPPVASPRCQSSAKSLPMPGLEASGINEVALQAENMATTLKADRPRSTYNVL